MTEVDPRAVVSPSAKLGNDVRIGPYAIVGDEVELGDGCVLDAHAVVQGPSTFGRNNHFYSFSIVGGDPQDLTYSGQRVRLEAGDDNDFHEFCTIHRGTIKGGGVTRVGNHNLIMAYAHIGHDCVIGDRTILINGAQLAGHIIVEDYATISSYCLLHQFSRIGRHSYIGAGTRLSRRMSRLFQRLCRHVTSAASASIKWASSATVFLLNALSRLSRPTVSFFVPS